MKLDHLILTAAYPEDVFGDDPKGVYRNLVKQFHPDVGGDEEVFKRLGELYKLALTAQERGNYGKRVTTDHVLITTRRHAYTVTRLRHQGHLASIYDATYSDDGDTVNATLKVARNPKDGQLIADEAKALKGMLKTDPEFFDQISLYLPAYIEAFGYRHGSKTRQAIAFRSDYPTVSLEDVQRAYPQGVHPKDSAWMMRRVLMGLGYVHALGWAHRQVNKRHILIQPEEHGLCLIDWTQATQQNDWDRKIAGQDVAEGIRSLKDITAMDKAPRRYIRFIEGCLRAPHRLPDAWTLKDEYDELIEELWGPRKFRPFTMPYTTERK